MKKIIDRYAEGLSSLSEEQLLPEWSATPQTDEPQELAWAQLMRGIRQAKESEPQQLWEPQCAPYRVFKDLRSLR